jgi:hypothetical protein
MADQKRAKGRVDALSPEDLESANRMVQAADLGPENTLVSAAWARLGEEYGRWTVLLVAQALKQSKSDLRNACKNLYRAEKKVMKLQRQIKRLEKRKAK